MYKRSAFVWSVLTLIPVVCGYAHFRDSIPNGKNVPHPCRPNYVWKGVGHENPLGGGVRNPFGRDFEANGKKWDECLCQTDSDGDGETNGEELGDPGCVWTPGDVPYTKIGLSHPGICEPIDSKQCTDKNDWEIDCSNPEFTCAEMDQTEDVHNITLQLTPTPVPPQATTYMCQGFDVPSDGNFHMIASEPLIANENVLHHIIVFACLSHTINVAKARYSEPVECDMNPLPCTQMLTIWAVGIGGSCLSSEYGLSLGLEGIQYVVLQMHWNNPEMRSDYEDSSGMTLYYTHNLRTYNGAALTVGPSYIELPPGYSEVVQGGTCTKECTEYLFPHNMYIAEILPHMHYLGRGIVVEQWRDAKLLATLLEDDDYSYDSPTVYTFQPALEIQPGDQLNVSCTFETESQDSFVFYGDSTSDEMCAAIMMYYPAQSNASYCGTVDGISFCGISMATGKAEECLDEQLEFFTVHFFDVHELLQAKCDPTGLSCQEGCADLIAELRTNHTCLHEDADGLIKTGALYSRQLPDDFVLMLISCDELPDKDDSPGDYDGGDFNSTLCGHHTGSAVTVTMSMIGLIMSTSTMMF